LSQIHRRLVADLSEFSDDIVVSLILSIIEAAFCVYFDIFKVNNFDKSSAIPFAQKIRPTGLPKIRGEDSTMLFPYDNHCSSTSGRK
jgi:hypothetical protein